MTSQITLSEKSGVRYLHFGSEWVQGAMRIRRPFSLELAYTREMMLPLLLRDPPWPKKILMIGLGAGSLAKFILRNLPESKLLVIEIDPQVVRAAHEHFSLPEQSSQFRIRIGDGADFVQTSPTRYDWIIVDGYDRHARSGALDREPFYACCRSLLTRQGLLTANLFHRSRGLQASIARLSSAFDRRAVPLASSDAGNVIAFASAGDPIAQSFTDLRARAIDVKATTDLDLRPAIGRLQLSAMVADGEFHL